MDALELTVIIVAAVVALIVLLGISYLIVRKCCNRLATPDADDQLDRLSGSRSSFGNRQRPQQVEDHYIYSPQSTWGSGYSDRGIYTVDNRRRVDLVDDRGPYTFTQPTWGTGSSGGVLPTYNGRVVDQVAVPSIGPVVDRTPKRPSYADITRYPAAAVENERRRPRPYDNSDVQPSRRDPAPAARAHRKDSKKRKEQQQQPPKLDENDTDINNVIIAMQGNLREDLTPDKTISQVQNLLHLTTDKSLISQDCRLIIGVDATPATQAGYCINLKERSLQYYVVRRDDLPWVLHDPKDPSEFEMKNFMFALTVWEKEILKWKRMCIYTDNFAITQAKCFDDNRYGERAFRVLRHYSNCKGVTVINMNNMAVNRFKNLKVFAKYIQPADDLSRWHIDKAIDFLTKLYGIDQENVQGTHCVDASRSRNVNAKAWYKPTPRYQQVLTYARDNINCLDCANASCSGPDLLQASLRRNKLPK